MCANGTGAPGPSLPLGYTGKTWGWGSALQLCDYVKGEVLLRSHKERLLVVGKWTGFISESTLSDLGNRGRERGQLAALSEKSAYHDRPRQSNRLPGTGWVAAEGWGVLFTVLWVLSAYRMQQPLQPPTTWCEAPWHRARLFHHAAEQWRMLRFLGNSKWGKQIKSTHRR